VSAAVAAGARQAHGLIAHRPEIWGRRIPCRKIGEQCHAASTSSEDHGSGKGTNETPTSSLTELVEGSCNLKRAVAWPGALGELTRRAMPSPQDLKRTLALARLAETNVG
jgi:hypothetical protein